MTRLAGVGLGLWFGAWLGLVGCEKDQPSAASPTGDDVGREASPQPKVVIEDPGVAPTPVEPAPQVEAQPSFGTTKIVATEVPCQTDADCVRSSCCHPTSCVAAADAPDCSASTCTMDCRGGTMDCYGGCLCQAGTCAAKLWNAPEE